jgi:O-antigen/teichoic acid export membrane protein
MNFLPTIIANFKKTKGATAGGILIAAAIVGNFLNLLYNAYLARAVSIEDFGLVSLIGSFLFLSTIPLHALVRAVTYKGAYFLGEYQTAIKDFWRYTRKRAILIGSFVTIIRLLLTPLMVNFFNAPTWHPFILFAPIWIIGAASAVDGGFLNGNLKFKIIAILIICEAFTKLFFTWIMVNFGFTRYVYAAIPASGAFSFLIGWFYVSRLPEKKVNIESKKLLAFPTAFFINSVLTAATLVAFISFDLILAKHYLPPKEAGQYANYIGG